ncbi:MAG TPA: hypothetical protein VK155_04805 [Bacteroidales bacterium]|jgi:hypothetical protein|nr:hypothetical protein [Bacteroidales bacterium]
MKAIMSALGKSLATVIFAVSLVAASCNTDTSHKSKDVRVKDNGRDMKVEQKSSNDSVTVKREESINRDKDGDSKTVIKKDVDRKDNNNNNSNTTTTNRNR